MTCPFTEEDIAHSKALLSSSVPLRQRATGGEGEEECATRLHHVCHCLWQMIRFAHLAMKGRPFRAAQWGLNCGRLQELLEDPGGVQAWWKVFEPILIAEDWVALEGRCRDYGKFFGLPQPDDVFVNRE